MFLGYKDIEFEISGFCPAILCYKTNNNIICSAMPGVKKIGAGLKNLITSC